MSSAETFDIKPIAWREGVLRLLDQRRLPGLEVWVDCTTLEDVIAAISDLVVRGAPVIGIAAVYGMVIAAQAQSGDSVSGCQAAVKRAASELIAARPTAVNLAWAVKRQLVVAVRQYETVEALSDALLCEARSIHESEVLACRAMGRFGAELVADGAGILTHCNAGALATGGYGTALGVIRAAVEAGKRVHVWVDETRPVLQGARLTAWELTRAGIPNTLIVDGAAASVIGRGEVDLVVVGADRIAANGDVANKIGTYGVALAAAAHDVPFVVAAPLSTVDLACTTGSDITIEQRDPDEVRRLAGVQVAPPRQDAANWAFDVTPHALVTAIVTETGVAQPPYSESLLALCALVASQ